MSVNSVDDMAISLALVGVFAAMILLVGDAMVNPTTTIQPGEPYYHQQQNLLDTWSVAYQVLLVGMIGAVGGVIAYLSTLAGGR